MELKPQSSPVNGRLWGARARDWANIQEGTVKAVYEAALERTGVGSDTRYLDVGCGAGGAVRLAAARGARPPVAPASGPRSSPGHSSAQPAISLAP